MKAAEGEDEDLLKMRLRRLPASEALAAKGLFRFAQPPRLSLRREFSMWPMFGVAPSAGYRIPSDPSLLHFEDRVDRSFRFPPAA